MGPTVGTLLKRKRVTLVGFGLDSGWWVTLRSGWVVHVVGLSWRGAWLSKRGNWQIWLRPREVSPRVWLPGLSHQPFSMTQDAMSWRAGGSRGSGILPHLLR